MANRPESYDIYNVILLCIINLQTGSLTANLRLALPLVDLLVRTVITALCDFHVCSLLSESVVSFIVAGRTGLE